MFSTQRLTKLLSDCTVAEFWENVPGFDEEAFLSFRDMVAEAEAETAHASS